MGIQSVGVMACAKHFAANNQEHWRYGLSANMDNRTLYEMYYYPFLRSIEVCILPLMNDHCLTFSSKADVSSVMCAYNRFNEVSSCHNAQLLGPNGLLRSDGFKGKGFTGVA